MLTVLHLTVSVESEAVVFRHFRSTRWPPPFPSDPKWPNKEIISGENGSLGFESQRMRIYWKQLILLLCLFRRAIFVLKNHKNFHSHSNKKSGWWNDPQKTKHSPLCLKIFDQNKSLQNFKTRISNLMYKFRISLEKQVVDENDLVLFLFRDL